MKKIRTLTYWLIAVVAVIGIGAMTIDWYRAEMKAQMAKGGQTSVRIGGPFTLTNHLGQQVSEKDYADKPFVIFFGYTYCPDVCPTTLADMIGWVDALGDDVDKLSYLFVTIDPERDNPDAMGEYVGAFFDQLVGLTGTQEQIDAVSKAYRVYAKRVEDEDGDPEAYIMDHTASIYLMKQNNEFMGTISYGEAHESALGKLQKLIATAQ
ncbi:MAG: SCO family protein [Cohaesibacter sp.]|nr:SCO family protein [Cohaesibacter sp.]